MSRTAGAIPGVRQVVVETMLSRRPRPSSAMVAGATLAVVAAGAGLAERGASASMVATPEAVFGRHEWWRLLSTLVVHADGLHLAGNALPLGLLAYLGYGYFGPVVHPVLSTLGAAGVAALVLAFHAPGVGLVGASGAVYLLAGFWLTSYLLIERRHSPGYRLFRALGFALVTLVPAALPPHVSHGSHAAGLVVGAVSGALHFAVRRPAIRASEVVLLESEAGAPVRFD